MLAKKKNKSLYGKIYARLEKLFTQKPVNTLV